jgi:hypothetical protein
MLTTISSTVPESGRLMADNRLVMPTPYALPPE